MRLVVDTNVFIGSVMSAIGANRAILRRCLEGLDTPLLGPALFTEYQAVLSRSELFKDSVISKAQRQDLFEAFCASATWVTPYFLWRPNLPDEGDNHLVELALSSRAWIVTWNVRDLRRGELKFPELKILDPLEYLKIADHEGD